MKPVYKIALVLLSLILLGLALILLSYFQIEQQQRWTWDELDSLPREKACLVLGAARYTANGQENLYFKYRIHAAQRVFAAGKCTHLVVSGDNRFAHYNEPEEMKQSLMRLGVPEARITCDYAGGRTLDSVLRFQRIFGQSSGIVISQKFHNQRALYIGQAHGLRLHGFNAQDVPLAIGIKTELREILARVRAFLDVHILHTEPRHGGEQLSLD